MTVFACPTPDVLPVATRGHYIVARPEPTAPELLDRIARRLLEHGSGEFCYAWQMARHRALLQVEQLLSAAKLEEQIEAQRVALPHLSK